MFSTRLLLNRFAMFQKFLNDAKSYYEAGLEKVDFKNQSEAARVNINQWVETKTQGEIQYKPILNLKLILHSYK